MTPGDTKNRVFDSASGGVTGRDATLGLNEIFPTYRGYTESGVTGRHGVTSGATKPPSKPTRQTRRRPTAPDACRCPKCGDELCVYWRGRAWCVACNEVALFGQAREAQP